MPIYEYECRKCGARNEFVETLGAGRILAKKCSACGCTRLKKIVSKAVYHPEVTLEDLGVNIQRSPAPQHAPQHAPEPVDGKCPYCGSELDLPGHNDS